MKKTVCRKLYHIKVYHNDSTFSWLNMGFKLELPASKCEAIIKSVSKQEQFKDARFEMVEVK